MSEQEHEEQPDAEAPGKAIDSKALQDLLELHKKLFSPEKATTEPEAATDQTIGVRVKALREAKELTQEDLAKEISNRGERITQQSIGRIEKGVRPITLNEAQRLAAVLKISVTDLLSPESPVSELRAKVWNALDSLQRRAGVAAHSMTELLDGLKTAEAAHKDYLNAVDEPEYHLNAERWAYERGQALVHVLRALGPLDDRLEQEVEEIEELSPRATYTTAEEDADYYGNLD